MRQLGSRAASIEGRRSTMVSSSGSCCLFCSFREHQHVQHPAGTAEEPTDLIQVISIDCLGGEPEREPQPLPVKVPQLEFATASFAPA